MVTVHYRVGGLSVSLESEEEDILPTLEGLFPRLPPSAVPKDALLLRVTTEEAGFALRGGGEVYRTNRRDTLVPAIEAVIRARYLAQAAGAFPLHSSGCLTRSGEALLFLGTPGAGKTTLLLRAMAAGVAGLSDEIHLWDPATGTVEAYLRAYAVKEGTFRTFPALRVLRSPAAPSWWNGHRLWYVAKADSARRRSRARYPLAGLVLLSGGSLTAPLRPVPQWQRLSLLLPHAWGDGSALSGPGFVGAVRALTALPLWQGGVEAALDWCLETESVAAGTGSPPCQLSSATL